MGRYWVLIQRAYSLILHPRKCIIYHYNSSPNAANTLLAIKKYDMRPITSTKLVMAGAAMTLGSRPSATHANGIDDPRVAAMAETSGNVQRTTVDTCSEIPMT